MPAAFAPAVLVRAVSAEMDARPVAAAAPPRSHTPMHWTLVGMAAGQAVDAVTTYQALHRDGTQEGNSALYGPHPSAARIAVTKAAGVGVLAWLTDRIYNRHPATAMALAGAIGGLGLAAAVHNHGTGH